MFLCTKFSDHYSAVEVGRLGASENSSAPFHMNSINRPLHHILALLIMMMSFVVIGRPVDVRLWIKMLSLMRRSCSSGDHLLRQATIVKVSCYVRATIVKNAVAVLDDGMAFGCNWGSYLTVKKHSPLSQQSVQKQPLLINESRGSYLSLPYLVVFLLKYVKSLATLYRNSAEVHNSQ
ncbi:hypothetical protein ACFX13_012416 [Malus domestica]